MIAMRTEGKWAHDNIWLRRIGSRVSILGHYKPSDPFGTRGREDLSPLCLWCADCIQPRVGKQGSVAECKTVEGRCIAIECDIIWGRLDSGVCQCSVEAYRWPMSTSSAWQSGWWLNIVPYSVSEAHLPPIKRVESGIRECISVLDDRANAGDVEGKLTSVMIHWSRSICSTRSDGGRCRWGHPQHPPNLLSRCSVSTKGGTIMGPHTLLAPGCCGEWQRGARSCDIRKTLVVHGAIGSAAWNGLEASPVGGRRVFTHVDSSKSSGIWPSAVAVTLGNCRVKVQLVRSRRSRAMTPAEDNCECQESSNVWGHAEFRCLQG